ncbi:heat-inducible transcriptional repressor HrcA [Polymorphobacter fuscus]|uniref:Heat-inducible transcription repressor HrcA n=1 Tax=Sandarakinorhabdus fusca TaxID=1439888 RepID=A0A7C9KY64_9SPHN|nr:heat-inducible transcriptional repressor HrcA [Polymorphobacter fuscus]KAB7645477.1 heat-inducible transcriptional repressor HrcA [Polymorphobacter fuscus]MQT17906.1 heat-inducible transcriptional repressor HrcA [Polymorphobacter fuscus]NJC08536.1 heat-inducible transcriptional repressor [Polymorphobacter fuscus]
MQSPSVAELNDRAREVFRQIVDSYLATGAPVGSRTLSKLGALGLSPASIRNTMQDLEELGLLAAPHTSAGRLPTQLGLRMFVDGMMQASEPSEDERNLLDSGLSGGAAIEDVLARTTTVLSGLSQCAGLVLVPRREMLIRQVSFVALSPQRALVILVGADGSVENRVVELPEGVPPMALEAAANYINARLAGLTLAGASDRLATEIAADRAMLDAMTAQAVATGLAAWSSDGAARPVLIVRGQANLVESSVDLDRVRQLLGDLEDKEELIRVLELARNADATKIFIGAESQLFSLSGSSVIAAPYRGPGGQVVGIVGVIGPTRLNYARVIPMVDYTARTLSRLVA